MRSVTNTTKQLSKDTEDRLIGSAQVCRYLGRSRKWLEGKWKPTHTATFDPNFPQPYRLSASSYAWSLKELQAWLKTVRVEVEADVEVAA